MSGAVATNKKAFRDFHLSDKIECGLELKGCEVKSIRGGSVNFKDSFGRIEKGQAWLHNLHIEPYVQASYDQPAPDRVRRLLLHKKEIRKLEGKVQQQGLTLIPTRIYFNKRGVLKVEIAVGRGKKSFDKREDMKRRTIDRSLRRMVKHQVKR